MNNYGFHTSKSLPFVVAVIVGFCQMLAISCDSYDNFTTDRSTTLTFSHDTVRFDTLLATVPSATKTLIVYNHADEGLRIQSIRLENGAASHFRVNIDGQDLSRTTDNMATDFDVRRRDSIIIRIEVTIPDISAATSAGSVATSAAQPSAGSVASPTQPSAGSVEGGTSAVAPSSPAAPDTVFTVSDRLIFLLESGVEQSTALVAFGQQADFHHGWIITADTTILPLRPIVIFDSLVVATNTTLTLEAGTQLLFHEGAGIDIRGRLLARGTVENPVILRGDRTDHIFDYLPYDRLPSRWQGMRLHPESTGNELEYLDLHSGRYGILCDSALTDTTLKLRLTNSRIHNIGGDGLRVKAARVEAANTEISNTLGHCVSLIGGTSAFTHCTLAQFYALDADRGDALRLTNRGDDDTYYPLHSARFVNCVITGYAEDVLMGSWFENQDYEANYYFQNCFIATEPTDDPARFVAITYDDPKSETASYKNFRLIDTHNFLYDFTPDSLSAIRGIADPAASRAWPLDRMGHDRLTDGAPDAGCYEFTASDKP